MKFLFDDESFSFETLRAAGYANAGGADLGEILVTARAIPEGDEAAWHREWKATAQRVEALGRESLAAGHSVSAREVLLRASNYYRTAEFYLREDPAHDPEAKALFTRSRDTFLEAMALYDFGFERIAIPYQDTTLPGYLYLVDHSGRPRPTVVFNGGYDSTLEESYVALAAGALGRGYNVLAFDGPGQGAALREQGLTFRPDWEAVLAPVVDFALTRPEIAPEAITVFGYSLGGYLVARASAFEKRLAAVILNDGVYNVHSALAGMMPPFLTDWIEQGNDAGRRCRGRAADGGQHPDPLGSTKRIVGLGDRIGSRPGPRFQGVHDRRCRRPDHHTDIGARRGERPVLQGRGSARRRRNGQLEDHVGDAVRSRRCGRALPHGRRFPRQSGHVRLAR